MCKFIMVCQLSLLVYDCASAHHAIDYCKCLLNCKFIDMVDKKSKYY